MYSAFFDEAFKITVGLEGGYSNDPDDAGGETKFGITKREHPNLDIKNLTVEDAKELYYTEVWNRLGLDRIEFFGIASELFDTAVNCGTVTAVRFAQRACNALGSTIAVDGYIGIITIAALNKHGAENLTLLLKAMNCLQGARYVEITEVKPNQKKFFRGWLKNRVTL